MPQSTGESRKLLFALLTLGFTLVAIVSMGELVLRFAGHRPWNDSGITNIRVEPGGRFHRKHPTLGYTHIPGSFRVSLGDQFDFQVDHLPNTLRVTRPLAQYPVEPPLPEIWIFGCSFTHGWALNDRETYPWRVQEELADYEVVNFGVNGYGTLHSLIQFEERLAAGERPEAVVVAYADFHDFRNTFTRIRRKTVSTSNSLGPLGQPQARFDASGALTRTMAEVRYTPVPLMKRFALLNYLEERFNVAEARHHRSRDVSRALLSEFHALAEAHGIEMVLAGIRRSPGNREMLAWARRAGIATIDISVDLDAEGNRHRYDLHPSALANRQYAETLVRFLRDEVL